MVSIKDSLRLFGLKIKAKLVKFWNSIPIQWILSLDLTPVFLFLGLKLLGYNWSIWIFIASIGAWLLIKETFKQIAMVVVAGRK